MTSKPTAENAEPVAPLSADGLGQLRNQARLDRDAGFAGCPLRLNAARLDRLLDEHAALKAELAQTETRLRQSRDRLAERDVELADTDRDLADARAAIEVLADAECRADAATARADAAKRLLRDVVAGFDRAETLNGMTLLDAIRDARGDGLPSSASEYDLETERVIGAMVAAIDAARHHLTATKRAGSARAACYDIFEAGGAVHAAHCRVQAAPKPAEATGAELSSDCAHCGLILEDDGECVRCGPQPTPAEATASEPPSAPEPKRERVEHANAYSTAETLHEARSESDLRRAGRLLMRYVGQNEDRNERYAELERRARELCRAIDLAASGRARGVAEARFALAELLETGAKS